MISSYVADNPVSVLLDTIAPTISSTASVSKELEELLSTYAFVAACKLLVGSPLSVNVPVIVSPDFSTFKLALPTKSAVTVPAIKLPPASRETIVLAVFALVAFDVIVYAVLSSADAVVHVNPLPLTASVLAYCPVVLVPNATASFAICVVIVVLPKLVTVAVPETSPPSAITKLLVLKLSFPLRSSYTTDNPVSVLLVTIVPTKS